MWEIIKDLYESWIVVEKKEHELVLKQSNRSQSLFHITLLKEETEYLTQTIPDIQRAAVFRTKRSGRDTIRATFSMQGYQLFLGADIRTIQTKQKVIYDLKWKSKKQRNTLNSMELWQEKPLENQDKEKIREIFHIFRTIVEKKIDELSEYRLYLVTQDIKFEDGKVTDYLNKG